MQLHSYILYFEYISRLNCPGRVSQLEIVLENILFFNGNRYFVVTVISVGNKWNFFVFTANFWFLDKCICEKKHKMIFITPLNQIYFRCDITFLAILCRKQTLDWRQPSHRLKRKLNFSSQYLQNLRLRENLAPQGESRRLKRILQSKQPRNKFIEFTL